MAELAGLAGLAELGRGAAPCVLPIVLLLALNPYRNVNQRESRRRDAGNAAGLSERLRAHALQRFAHLARKAADDAVLQPLRDDNGLGRLETRDGLLLLLKVAGKFDLGFDGAGLVAAGTAGDGCVHAIRRTSLRG